MGIRTRQRATEVTIPPRGVAGLWPTEVAQLLEEHHLAAWSHHPQERERFGTTLADHLSAMEDTDVIVLQGRRVHDIASLEEQLFCRGNRPPADPSIDGPRGLIPWLRRRPGDGGATAIKRRYYIWQDADALLRHDPALFGRVVDAITGVAAEAEYASEDLLLLHRAVFIGGPALDVYAEDDRGQFRSWLREDGERPLWEIVSGLKRPPVLPYHIAMTE